MRFIPITYWSHGTFFLAKRAFQKSTEKKLIEMLKREFMGNVLLIV